MLFIGLMSGTSTDGVDAVLCRIQNPTSVQVIQHYALPMNANLRAEIVALNQPGYDELNRAALVANQLGQLYAHACSELLKSTHYEAKHICAIGVHGQTVRHAPQLGFSLQLNAPALLAELTNIDVIADFRSRDIAAGGQGAPLVPIFHQAVFSTEAPRVILNLGGIANISILRPNQSPLGFDTGPANVLLDEWIQRHHGLAYDENGAWAAKGIINQALLDQLLSEPWLATAPPKSTGRDLFNQTWLQHYINERSTQPAIAPVDVQATLTAFTAHTIGNAIRQYANDAEDIIVCGGGAYNTHLLDSIATQTKKPVRNSDELGIGAQQVEAAAFAWLAYANCQNLAAGQPSITGARHSTILGALYKG